MSDWVTTADGFGDSFAGNSGGVAGAAWDISASEVRDDTCRNCGQTGHFARECTEPKVEHAFNGACRRCEIHGHRAVDCPDRVTQICDNCHEPGHFRADCTAARDIGMKDIPNVTAADALRMMRKAGEDRDLDDFKLALFAYVKAKNGEPTYHDMAKLCRSENFDIHIVALARELSLAFTAVSLQGKQGMKYVVSYQFSEKPRRRQDNAVWPKSQEDNLQRLKDAGDQMSFLGPICRNCGEAGHSTKACPQEKKEADIPVMVCLNCNEEGHRMRACPHPIKYHNGPILCNNCNEEGHKAIDCDKPRKIFCSNCDDEGHLWKVCPKPKDWSRVKCKNCGETGHTVKRCPTAPVEEKDGEPEDLTSGWKAGSSDVAGGTWDAVTFANADTWSSSTGVATNAWDASGNAAAGDAW